jgi:integrase
LIGRQKRYDDEPGPAPVNALTNERMRVAIDLAVSTGQRRGDLLSLTRAQLRDDGIYFKQSKTGAEITIERRDHNRVVG